LQKFKAALDCISDAPRNPTQPEVTAMFSMIAIPFAVAFFGAVIGGQITSFLLRRARR
jgi:uncharacterized integral membrane protein